MMNYLCKATALVGAALLGSAAIAEDFEDYGEDIYFLMVDTAIAALSEVQEKSFQNNKVYCGVVYAENDDFKISEFSEGDLQECDLPESALERQVVAIVYSGGAHDPKTNSELPTKKLLRKEKGEGHYRFWGTPGGRVWMQEPESLELELVCQTNCIPRDPRYDELDHPELPFVVSQAWIREHPLR